MASFVLYILLIYFQSISCSEQRKAGFIDKINHGMKVASNFLGSESVALKVAEFVVRAFQTVNNQPKANRNPSYYHDSHGEQTSYGEYSEENKPSSVHYEAASSMAPLKQFVRLFGLQPSQISAVAVNALVFVAQMISTFLAGPKRQKKQQNSDDLTTWILNKNSRILQDLISRAKNESLPDTIEEIIKEQGSEEETSCIRLFVCKITPVISRMQKTVFGEVDEMYYESKQVHGVDTMYRHLPTRNEINRRSDICERRHISCNLNE